MSPDIVGQYRLGSPLGESGRGIVYRALEAETNRTVALKLVPPEKLPNPAVRQKFLAESRAAVGLAHAHLRQLYEVGESGEQIYLAMEYLEGATLKNLLVGGRVDAETALEWGAEIADALAALHAAGHVHGDLRSARVFITSQGTVKLLEAALWRLAAPAGQDLSKANPAGNAALNIAAVSALAPEQVRGGEPDARSDTFSLGTLLYEMVSGRHPFVGRNFQQTVHWVLTRAPEPLGDAPALDAVLARALEKDPAERFASAADFAAALRALAAGGELPAEVMKRAVKVRATARLWWAIGALAALLVAWFAYLALTRP